MSPQGLANGCKKSLIRALFLGLALSWPGTPPFAATTELFVSDWQTGIALYGFDPVAFFVEGAPLRGSALFEVQHAGAVFRFRNEGNRAAFKANPEIYMPRFGGYDPVAVGRGSPAAGYPNLFVIRDERLFFFATEKNRASFLATPKEAIAAADTAWPRVKRGLVH
jgi:YHS domain-containing protein